MKKIFTLGVLFITVAMMLIGCAKEKSNDNTGLALLLLLSQSNTMAGTQEDVSSGSQAATASTAATSVASGPALMNAMNTTPTSSIVGDGVNNMAKDSMEKSIIAAVSNNAAADMKGIAESGRKNATAQLNITVTDAVNGTGYSITPNLTITGSVTATLESGTIASGTYTTRFTVNATVKGDVTAQFTNYTVPVFDVYNFIRNRTIAFTNVTLSGTCATTLNSTSNMNLSFVTVTLVTTVNGTSSSNSTATVTATGLSITPSGGSAANHNFSITARENSNWTFSKPLLSVTYASVSGSFTASVTGTVDSSSFSYSYAIDSSKLLSYLNQGN